MDASATSSPPPSSFLDRHRKQLESVGFPPTLYSRLESKLVGETFDAGDTFGVVEDESQRRAVVCSAANGLEPQCDVWLIDHLYSFQVETYRQDLQKRPELLSRLAVMMGLEEPHEDGIFEEETPETSMEKNPIPPLASVPTPGLRAEKRPDSLNLNEETLCLRRPHRRERPTLYEQVCEQIWRYVSSYRLVDPGDPFKFKTVWFVKDEFGSAFQHAPPALVNFRISPFIYFPPTGSLKGAMGYSLAWPIANIAEGEECTHDYAFGCADVRDNSITQEEKFLRWMKRACRLAVWFELPLSVRAIFEAAHAERKQLFLSLAVSVNAASKPVADPSTALAAHFSRSWRHSPLVLRVYNDNGQVLRHLSRADVQRAAEPAEADVLWVYHTAITPHYRRRHGLGLDVVVSQTGGDECLVFKHLLPLTATRAPGSQAWLPDTYNMETETAAFIHEYSRRSDEAHRSGEGAEHPPHAQEHGPSTPLSPLFILKPWNLGRSMDSAVADSLPQALQLAKTCPKVASQYVYDIATVNDRKFDVRYRLFVRAWEPLEIFRWVHWGVRVSNHPYSLAAENINDFQVRGPFGRKKLREGNVGRMLSCVALALR